MGHELRWCPVAIALGSRDLGVAAVAASLFEAGWFSTLVFSGGNSPSTVAPFPRGEAVHFREHARSLGVPDEVMLTEPDSTNTGENIEFSRRLLERVGFTGGSVLLISKPYMQRRAFATCRKVWPEVEVRCASDPASLDEYLAKSGNPRYEINMMVGDLQRVLHYPQRGFSIPQHVPPEVVAAAERLVDAGFSDRVLVP
jgi:uncharacterized SAM-binding protein YcdF (DUF218 family)